MGRPALPRSGTAASAFRSPATPGRSIPTPVPWCGTAGRPSAPSCLPSGRSEASPTLLPNRILQDIRHLPGRISCFVFRAADALPVHFGDPTLAARGNRKVSAAPNPRTTGIHRSPAALRSGPSTRKRDLTKPEQCGIIKIKRCRLPADTSETGRYRLRKGETQRICGF